MQVGCSKRNVGCKVEHMGVRAERLAQKRDLQDIIRELEILRANIAKKVDKNDNQHDKVLFITNAAGEASPLDTEWGGDEGLDADDFTVLLKESAAQMLRLCGPPRAEASEQADEEEVWDEWLYVPFGENFSVYFCALCFG
ncbi:hypothetical protein D1007_34121 [Hordeum vulgare]|nr:hypothetical protein D1007_34121 [Hordeum vulgare]